jgi:hypothetical protein
LLLNRGFRSSADLKVNVVFPQETALPNPLPKEITNFKDAVAWFLRQPDYVAPKVKVLADLYQGSSDLFHKNDAYSESPETSGGICQGMALTWIKKNNVAGGSKAFRTEANTSWDTFAKAQVEITHRKLSLRPHNDELIRRNKAFAEEVSNVKADRAYALETGFVADIKHSVIPPKTQAEITSAIQALSKAQQGLKDFAAQLQEETHGMYASMVFQTDSQSHKLEKLFESVTLADVVPKIRGDSGRHPAYYMVNMNQAGGHCIAIHAAYHPRLLDANSCEFQFDSINTLYDFLGDYWQVYKRSGFAAARVEIYRFDVQVTQSTRELVGNKRALMADIRGA